MTFVVKRNAETMPFDENKIFNAVIKAMRHGSGLVEVGVARQVASNIKEKYEGVDEVSIYDIEDDVFFELCNMNHVNTAKAYEGYRLMREFQRENNTIDDKVIGLIDGSNKETLNENSNKQATLISTQRDLVAEEVSKDISLRMKLPTHLAQAHTDGLIHIHDLGHYLNPSFNCCLINLEDMLGNGTVINGKMIEKPKSFRTACTITTQIIAQVASGQFGGQTISLAQLSPFVRISEEKIRERIKHQWDTLGMSYTDSKLEWAVYDCLKREVQDGIQTLQYQINTLQTSNGQAPFLSLFMYISEYPEYEKETAMLIREVLKQRLLGLKNEVGVYITPAFPKLLYVQDDNNAYPESDHYEITKLAGTCIAKRMMPDLLSARILKANYDGNVVPPMGCRAFLSPWRDEEGKSVLYGRFNMGVTTINLADVGLSANGDLAKFWDILYDRLELCKESLMLRYAKLKDVTSDVSPIHWQHGAISRLPKHAPIYDLLQDGYATITLGYIGVYECVMALIGESHTTERGQELAIEIMKHLKQATSEWKAETGLGFALYGTPSESLTEKFAKACRRRHGVIEGLTDRDYLTNSYHVFVQEDIDAYAKLEFESQFHEISSGGAISYIEVPNMQNNPEAILNLMQFMYENVQYAEVNTKSDYCHQCGFDGEILVDKDLNWYCPNCGNTDQTQMNVVRRTCGYLGENYWNQGRTQEISERVMHI